MDAAPFKGGAGGGGGAVELALVPQGNLPVGADVGQQRGVRAVTHPAHQDGHQEVRPQKGGDAAGQEAALTRPFPKEVLRHERCSGEGFGGEALVEMQHGGVAGDDHGADAAFRDAGLPGQLLLQLPDGALHHVLQGLALAGQGGRNPADDVVRHLHLGVEAGGRCQLPAGFQVHQQGGDGGGADVHRQAGFSLHGALAC